MSIFNSRSLGGKLGASLTEELQVQNMGDLCQFSLQQLQTCYGSKTGYVHDLSTIVMFFLPTVMFLT